MLAATQFSQGRSVALDPVTQGPDMNQLDSASLLAPNFWGHRGPGSVLTRLVIIGPYPTPDFFDLLPSELRVKPKSVLLVVDDGWSANYVEGIEERLARLRIEHRVRYAS